jgi:CPA2 family monovalent cation:H+ antiporter-2
MPNLTILRDLVVIFAAALLVVALLRRLRVPTIAGFILAGVLIGPYALGLVGDLHGVEVQAEVGVVLLLYGIGLELSLDKMRRFWRPALAGGVLQVGLTLAATAAIARGAGLAGGQAVFLGCLVAVSSTAVVLRVLAARGEVDAPHGRLALGILIFQDLAVVPMILVIPLLAGTAAGSGSSSPVLALAKGFGVLVGVLVLARLVVPRLLGFVARTRQRDLFVLAVFLVCFGTAWAVSRAGLSLALGAFLGGLVVSGSEFRHQALADLVPLREVFASVFFVSVGMLLDPGLVAREAGLILLLFVAIVAGKFLMMALTGMILRIPPRTALLTGAALAQVGEFAFVLLHAADGTALVPANLADPLLVAIILSMAITPLVLAAGPFIAAGADRILLVERALRVRAPEEAAAAAPLSGHVIIAGYGPTGREVAGALRERGVVSVVLDLNPVNIDRALTDGINACYGDVASERVLEKLGVSQARLLVVTVNDPDAAIRAVAAARRLAPGLRIIGRTTYATDVERLRAHGADEVVAAETAAMRGLREVVLAGCASGPGRL